jgi:hypothetical protein
MSEQKVYRCMGSVYDKSIKGYRYGMQCRKCARLPRDGHPEDEDGKYWYTPAMKKQANQAPYWPERCGNQIEVVKE